MGLGDVLPSVDATYGEEVAFATGSRLAFPDFTVEFLGTASDLPITFWRFEVRNERDRIEVGYGVGGVLSSAEFVLGGKRYALDLVPGRSDLPSALVVSEAARE